MAFVRIARSRWFATRQIGKRIVPIVPDEARTFGMEGMFREVGHLRFTSGQLYEPVDSDRVDVLQGSRRTARFWKRGLLKPDRLPHRSMLPATGVQSASASTLIPFYHLLLHVWLSAHRRL